MKNTLTLFIFFIIGTINAQIINIPDANFKAKLVSATSSNNVAQDLNYNSIVIDTNGNGEIEESEALVVNTLDVSNSNIASIDGIQYFTNLVNLVCNSNLISFINVSQLYNLLALDCSYNNLSSITLGNLPHFFALRVNSNNLSSIDFSDLPNLETVYAALNQLINVDFSNNYHLTYVDFFNNNLQYVNLKNGNTQNPENFGVSSFNYQNNPNLQFICANDNFVSILQTVINSTQGVPNNVVVSSYCSFTPGGTFYTIQGTTKYDQNINGCDAADSNFANLKINATDGTTTGTLIANTSGNYTLPVSAGTHTILPILENSSYFTISPSATSITFPTTASPFVQNFCISPNGVHNDLAVELIPTGNVNPGYDSQYILKYQNKGTQMQSGSVNFTFQDAVLDVVTINPLATTTAFNSLSWNFNNLQPFEARQIVINLNANTPLESPPVNSGDVLNFNASINGLTDETPADNTVVVNQTASNSFDPNDKTCLEGSTINPSKIGDFVHYRISFENNGTANAQNVVVKDLIDTAKFDISSLQFVYSSHSCITKISNVNKVEFIFEGINLPFNDANNDGYIVFKIKSKATLTVGDQITNNASIYFDYNAPITTNTVTSTYQALANVAFDFDTYFTLSPVPAKEYLNINNKQQIAIKSISVYNVLGQLVLTFINPNNTIDVSNLNSGNYILKVWVDNKESIVKFVKE